MRTLTSPKAPGAAHQSPTPTRQPLPESLLFRLVQETLAAEATPTGWSFSRVPVHAGDPAGPARSGAGTPAVSRPSDAAEREADAVAARVATGRPAFGPGGPRSAAAPIARAGAGTGRAEPSEDGAVEPELADDPWPDAETATAVGAGQADQADQGEQVLASRDAGPAQVSGGFREALDSSDSGVLIPQPARTHLESAFGRSFGQVRLHRGERSDRLSGAIGARAFTWGSDIHFADHAPAASTPAGLRLLAHELTHVCQQGGRGGGPVHRSEALFFSTLGKQGYFQYAGRFHADHGFPAPVRVSSVEEMLEQLVGISGAPTRVRLVTHAVPSGIFLPLLRSGGTSLFQADLRLQSQSTLEGELGTEHATVGRDDREETIEHHVVPRGWATRLYRQLATDPTWTVFQQGSGLPASLSAGGDLETYLWWLLDRAMLTTQKPGTGRRRDGSPVMEYVLGGFRPAFRAQAVVSIDRTIAIYRALARQHLVARAPARLPRADKEARADQTLTDLQTRVDREGPLLVRTAVTAGDYQPQPVSGSTPRYESIQGAVARGTFANNLLIMKSRLPHGMPFEIRGCRIGQNSGWLSAFRTFWGMGVGGPPGGRRPDVSAPDLRHIFGLRPVGRGRQARTVSEEWLEGPRKRRIYGGTPEFDDHIVHAQ